MKIGFVGLGIMGRPMALNILKGGFDLTVWARRAESMAPLLDAGAKGAASAAEVAAGCDVVFSMVSDAADVEQVALGAGGVVEGARPGLIFVDMSTIAPAAAQAIAARLAERGLTMLDAPVSGGEVGAISGGLTIMVGGDAAAFDKVKPVLACMGKSVTLIGGSGAGQVTKACNQILTGVGVMAVAEALKHGGITNMMDRLSNPAKIIAFDLAEELKEILTPLFEKHMDDIMSGAFSSTMMEDWKNNDKKLLTWRAQTAETAFEKTESGNEDIPEQEFFDNGILMVAMVKAGVELAFDVMVSAGIKEESAYYESLHEVPLIANTIARKKLYEMNVVISDTAEYGCYLFAHQAVPLLKDFIAELDTQVIGEGLDEEDNGVDNLELIAVNSGIRNSLVEYVGAELRMHMSAMKPIL